MANSQTFEQLARELAAAPAEVQHFVQRAVQFEREEGELFRSPRVTLAGALGDCDCQARLVVTMLRALGFASRLAFLAADTGNPKHVVAQAWDDNAKAWQWVETTMDADYAESPVDAAVRLGAMRDDVRDFGRVAFSRVFPPMAPR